MWPRNSLIPGMPGSLGFGLVSVGHGDELRPHLVAVVGPDDPAGSRCIPTNLLHIGLQARVAVQVIALGDAAAVRKDLRTLGVLVLGNVAEFLQQRDVHIGLDVAGDPRIAVPVPGAADVGRPVDQPDALHAEFAQPHAGQQPTEAGADDRHVHLVGERLAGEVPRPPTGRRRTRRTLPRSRRTARSRRAAIAGRAPPRTSGAARRCRTRTQHSRSSLDPTLRAPDSIIDHLIASRESVSYPGRTTPL